MKRNILKTCSEPLVWTCHACGHSFHEAEWESSDRKCPACEKLKGRWKCSLCQESFAQPALGRAHPCHRDDSYPLETVRETQPALAGKREDFRGRTVVFFVTGGVLLLAASWGLFRFFNLPREVGEKDGTPTSVHDRTGVAPLPAFEFTNYENSLFSFRASYPMGLVFPKGDPEDPAGARFSSPDGLTSLIVYGSENVPPVTVAQALAKEASTFENSSREIQSKQEGADYFELQAREGNKGILIKQILRNGKWRKLRLEYPLAKAAQLEVVIERVAGSFVATDPVAPPVKMYFFYHPDLKRIYDSEFFDGAEKIGVPPDSGPFVYQPSESSVRISNMNRNRVFGNSYGGVFFEGKVVPGQIYVFRNDFLTGSWRRLSTAEAISLLRENGITPPRSSSGKGEEHSKIDPPSTEVPQGNRKVSKMLKLPEYTGTPHTDQLDRPSTR